MAPDKLVLHALVAVLATVFSGGARAQLFVCTAPSGRTITADRPPLECADRPVRELRPDGSVRRIIEPPLTPEQRAAREAEARRQIEEAERQRGQMRRDLSLLETYGSENEIEATRNRALSDRQVLIERAVKKMDELKRERKKLDDESEFFSKRELPEKLKRELAANNDMVKSQQKAITDVRADMARVNERYDAEARRFRELVTSGAQPVQRTSDKN